MNPKNYSVWEHRKWVLQEMPKANWDQEMMLVEAYLAKDGRNCVSILQPPDSSTNDR